MNVHFGWDGRITEIDSSGEPLPEEQQPNSWMGRSPDGECDDYIPDYEHDLNAIRRVVVKISETVEGRIALKSNLFEAWIPFADTTSKAIWQACIPPLDYFCIIGEALAELNKEKEK